MNRLHVNGTHRLLHEFKSGEYLSLQLSMKEQGFNKIYGMVINVHEPLPESIRQFGSLENVYHNYILNKEKRRIDYERGIITFFQKHEELHLQLPEITEERARKHF